MLYVSCCVAATMLPLALPHCHPALIITWQQREVEATAKPGGHHRNVQLETWLKETRSAQGILDCFSQSPFNRCLVHLELESGKKTWLSCEMYLHEPDRCAVICGWLHVHNKLGMSTCRSLVACQPFARCSIHLMSACQPVARYISTHLWLQVSFWCARREPPCSGREFCTKVSLQHGQNQV